MTHFFQYTSVRLPTDFSTEIMETIDRNKILKILKEKHCQHRILYQVILGI